MTQLPVPEELVQIELGGRTRYMMLTMGDVRRLRTEYGLDIFMSTEEAEKKASELGIDAAIKVLWYALRHDDPDLTVEDVEELVHFGNLAYVVERVTDIYKQAGPPDALKGEPEETTTEPTTEPTTETGVIGSVGGSTSGPSVSTTSG